MLPKFTLTKEEFVAARTVLYNASNHHPRWANAAAVDETNKRKSEASHAGGAETLAPNTRPAPLVLQDDVSRALAVFIRDHGGGWASKKAFD